MALYMNFVYEKTKKPIDSEGGSYSPEFVRSDTIVIIGDVSAAGLSNFSVESTVCKILPDGSAGACISRTENDGIQTFPVSANEKRIVITLFPNSGTALADPGQRYVFDVEVTFDEDFSVGTTVGDPVTMKNTIKGQFSISEDYTLNI